MKNLLLIVAAMTLLFATGVTSASNTSPPCDAKRYPIGDKKKCEEICGVINTPKWLVCMKECLGR